jgi:hypothetical protein
MENGQNTRQKPLIFSHFFQELAASAIDFVRLPHSIVALVFTGFI